MGNPTEIASVTVERRPVLVFNLRSGHEWAKFTVDDQPKMHHLTIDGSYGGWSYIWTSPGPCFLDFLAGLNMSYVGGKMCQGDRGSFDPDATTRRIREFICQERRREGMTAEEAREEWDHLPASGFEHEGDFYDWMRDTSFEDAHEFYVESPGYRSLSFGHMYERFWSAFAAAAVAESAVASSRREAVGG